MSTNDRGTDFVSIGTAPVEVGRTVQASLRLTHPTVSRNHARLTLVAEGILLEDHDSKFGTFVDNVRVRSITVQPGARIRFGTAIVYRVESDGLKLDAIGEGMEIQASGLMISRGGRVLVQDADFSVSPNSFIGILGPSGSGKSTLLNSLASFQAVEKGKIFFDGGRDIVENLDEYRAMLGHVPQEDIVYSWLTVRENLDFAARLRSMASDELPRISELVDRVLARVRLEEHAQKRAAVLSGGQRKRLNVAIELLKRPRLLVVDEPTSGLDPASESRLMEQLRHVARQGTTVICTTHLMDNLRLFDQIIVIGVRDGVGRIAYVGAPAEMLGHFGCRSFADTYEKLAAGQFTPILPSPSSPPTAAPQPSTSSNGTAARLPLSAWLSRLLPRTKLRDFVTQTIADNAWFQLMLLGQRAALRTFRDRGLYITMLAQPLVLGLLVCLTQFDNSEILYLNFFCVVISVWLGMNNSARDLVCDRKHYVRERLAGLHPESYLGAKCLVHLTVGVLQILLLLLIIGISSMWTLKEVPLQDLARSSKVWLFFVFWCSYACGLGLGLLVSALARTEEAAVAALPLLIMPQLLLSVVAAGQVDEPYTNSRRAFRPLVLTVREKTELKPIGRIVDCASLLCYVRPAAILAEPPGSHNYDEYWVGDLCHLLILLFGTWTLTYVAFLHAEQKWLKLIGLG